MYYNVLGKVLRDSIRIDRIDYPQVPVVTVAHDTSRTFPFEGKYYSPLIDTLQDDLRQRGTDCLSISRVISTIKGDIAYGDVRSPEGGFARALLQKRLMALLSPKSRAFSSWEENVWGEILDKTGAKKLVGIQPSAELCAACHKRGVWVADMQHGVISPQHPWYEPRFLASPREHLPDAVLCWDHGSAAAITAAGSALGMEAPVVGNRWLARFVDMSDSDTMAQRIAAAYPDKRPEGDRRPTVLLSLSWGEADIPNGFLVPELERTIRATSGEFRWLIRLHPNQMVGFATKEGTRFQPYFERVLRGHAEWHWATMAPLPIVLAQVDAHISWWSSVAIEASLIGVRSALLSPRLKTSMQEHFAHFCKAGLVNLVEPLQTEITGWVAANALERSPSAALARENESYSKLLDFLAGRDDEQPRSGW